MKAIPTLFFILLVGFVSLLAGVAAAATPNLTGAYSLDKTASDDMVEAFEPALQEMGRVRRGFARRYLSNIEVDETLRIHDDQQLTIRSGDNPEIQTKTNGESTQHINHEGDPVVVRATRNGQGLMLRIESDQAITKSHYRLTPDASRLIVETTVTSDQLPLPVTYRQVFNRD